MASGFAPEFLILIGVDVFLGASVLTVLLDDHFPNALPYVLELSALAGFAELASGASYLPQLSSSLQFYYSFTYATISVMTLVALNLYLLLLRRRRFESAIFGVFATVPSALVVMYFTSAFVNDLLVTLPYVPVVSIDDVYAMFAACALLIGLCLFVFGRKFSEVRA